MEINLRGHIIWSTLRKIDSYSTQGHVFDEYGCWITSKTSNDDIGKSIGWDFWVDTSEESYYIDAGCTRKFRYGVCWNGD